MKSHSSVSGFALLAAMLSVIGGTVYAMGALSSRTPSVRTGGATTQSVYTCLGCHALSLRAGPCALCTEALQARHLLGTQKGQAQSCHCAADCRCASLGIIDGMCACGRQVVAISAKGLYLCPRGCQYLSVTAGRCGCGKRLERVGAAVKPLAPLAPESDGDGRG